MLPAAAWPGQTVAEDKGMERVKGIEPSYEAWEAAVLPLNYTRKETSKPRQRPTSGRSEQRLCADQNIRPSQHSQKQRAPPTATKSSQSPIKTWHPSLGCFWGWDE